MHLFALVITICNLATSQCDNFVPALYKSSADCEAVADTMRHNPTPGVELIFCAPTTRSAKRHAH